MVTEGDEILGGERTMQYILKYIIELYTYSTLLMSPQ